MPSNMPPPIPRKFSEKIALQKQHEAEGTAEFSKIMAEVSAVTGAQRTNRPSGSQSNLSTIGIDDGGYGGGIGGSITGISLGNSIENIQVGGMTGMTSGGMTLIGNVSSSGGGRLLAPDFNSVASRHGSLPNVGERVQLAARQSQDMIPRINSSTIGMSQPTTLQQIDQPMMQNLGPGEQQMIHQGSGMGSISPSASGANKAAGPIRQQRSSRIDTSPYRADRSDRFSTSSVVSGSGSNQHLFPPENWRRAISDSSIPSAITIGTNMILAPGSSGAPSPLNYSELGSPLPKGSPSFGIEGHDGYFGNQMDPRDLNNQQMQDISRYLDLPKDNIDTTKGSLPDLSNCCLSSSPIGLESQLEEQASHYSSMLPRQPLPQSIVTSPQGPCNMPLSKESVSKILSIPVSMLNDDTNTTNNFNTISGSNNINGDQQQDSYMYPVLLDEAIKLMDQQPTDTMNYLQYMAITESEPRNIPQPSSLLSYRNPSSPIGYQGNSPLHRSTSPMEPTNIPLSPMQPSPGMSSLNSELTSAQLQLQRFNMQESSSYPGHGMYFPNQPQSSPSHQPMEFQGASGIIHQSVGSFSLNLGQSQARALPPNSNPQTPSGIPEIILTDTNNALPTDFDDLTDIYIPDLALQLTPLDPSEIRLLDENALGITDPSTEDRIINENYHLVNH